MPRPKTPPKYRLHRPSGLAVVTIDGRDHYLGRHGTKASRELYARLIAEREQADGRPIQPRRALSIVELCLAHWRWARENVNLTDDIRAMIQVLRQTHARCEVGAFGPRALKAVRAEMVKAGWSRKTVNKRVSALRRMFRWGVAEELVPVEAHHALMTVEGLRRGELGVKESEPVQPVPLADIDAVLDHLTPPVRAIVLLQLHTGARCGELVGLRPVDIDVSGDVWRADLREHKGTHRGRVRTLWFGPRAQAVLRPFLDRPAERPLFRPVEGMQAFRDVQTAQRTPPTHHGNRVGSNRKAKPAKKPGETYDTSSVRRALAKACRRAGVDVFSPHRLRHTAAMQYRAAAGVEAASCVLGHGSIELTARVYATRDEDLAKGAAMQHG